MTCNPPMRAERGRDAERAAERYLAARGLTLRERNYRCRAGEIDLIMNDGERLVFVEVRLRSRGAWGSAAETVDWRKQKKLTRAAHYYLQARRLTDRVACRFDVVAFDPRSEPAITWVRDAFGAA